MRMSVERRFLGKVDKTDSCWIWVGARDQNGYGRFVVNYRQTLAHRWSYGHFVGPVPEGAWVLHKCDNPPCVNPEHLFLGDALLNNWDRAHKIKTGTHPRLRTVLIDLPGAKRFRCVKCRRQFLHEAGPHWCWGRFDKRPSFIDETRPRKPISKIIPRDPA